MQNVLTPLITKHRSSLLCGQFFICLQNVLNNKNGQYNILSPSCCLISLYYCYHLSMNGVTACNRSHSLVIVGGEIMNNDSKLSSSPTATTSSNSRVGVPGRCLAWVPNLFFCGGVSGACYLNSMGTPACKCLSMSNIVKATIFVRSKTSKFGGSTEDTKLTSCK